MSLKLAQETLGLLPKGMYRITQVVYSLGTEERIKKFSTIYMKYLKQSGEGSLLDSHALYIQLLNGRIQKVAPGVQETCKELEIEWTPGAIRQWLYSGE